MGELAESGIDVSPALYEVDTALALFRAGSTKTGHGAVARSLAILRANANALSSEQAARLARLEEMAKAASQ